MREQKGVKADSKVCPEYLEGWNCHQLGLEAEGENSKFSLGHVFEVCVSAGLPSREEPATAYMSLEFRVETPNGDTHLETSLHKQYMKPRGWVRPPGEWYSQRREKVILLVMKLRHRGLNNSPSGRANVQTQATQCQSPHS